MWLKKHLQGGSPASCLSAPFRTGWGEEARWAGGGLKWLFSNPFYTPLPTSPTTFPVEQQSLCRLAVDLCNHNESSSWEMFPDDDVDDDDDDDDGHNSR
jgi:hypothetical protein